DLHGRVLVRAIAPAQMPVEVLQLQSEEVDRVRALEDVEAVIRERSVRAAVRPRADQQPRAGAGGAGAALALHADEVLERAAEEDVEPAADVERGHLDLRVAPVDRERVPVLVVRRVVEPVEVEAGPLRIGKFDSPERQMREELLRLPGTPAVAHHPDPEEVEAEVERAALVDPAAEEVTAGHDRADRAQMRR